MDKECISCGEVKDIGMFYLRKYSGKYRPNCKECFKIVQTSWLKQNRDKRVRINAKYNKNNKVKLRRLTGTT